MRWNLLINQITVKANQTLAMIKKFIKLVPENIKDKAYKSLVRPQLEFASSVCMHGPHGSNLSLTKLRKSNVKPHGG